MKDEAENLFISVIFWDDIETFACLIPLEAYMM